MTQARGQQAYLMRHELPESSYGVDPASVHSIKLPFNTSGITATRNLIEPTTITGRRDAVAPAQGRRNVAGSVVVPIDQCAIGYWLEMLMGSPATTMTGSAYQHVFKVSSVMKSYAIEQGHADLSEYIKYSGMKANGFSMRIGGDEELTMSIDLIGQAEAMGGSSMSSRITTLSFTRFHNADAILQEGGAALDGKVTELNLAVANNLDEAVYCIASGGGGKRGDLPEGLAHATGDMRIMFENRSYYLMAASGSERSLTVTFRQNSFYLELDIDELIFERHTPPVETPLGLWVTLPFRAYYNDGSNASVIQATLVNTWSAYSGHL